MFESRSEFVQLQSAFLVGEADSRRSNYCRWSHQRLTHLQRLQKLPAEKQDEHFLNLSPRRRFRRWGSPSKRRPANLTDEESESSFAANFSSEQVFNDKGEAADLCGRVLATLNEIVANSSSKPDDVVSNARNPTPFDASDWRLILATVLLEKHVQQHVDPRLIVSSGYDGASFLEGAVGALSGGLFPETFLPELIRRLSAEWLAAILSAALQYPLGAVQRELLHLIVENATEQQQQQDGDNDRRNAPMDEKFCIILYHLLLFENSLVSPGNDGVTLRTEGDPKSLESDSESQNLLLDCLAKAKYHFSSWFGLLPANLKLKLGLILIFAVDDLDEKHAPKHAPTEAPISSVRDIRIRDTSPDPKVLFPAFWSYKERSRQLQNRCLNLLAQTQGTPTTSEAEGDCPLLSSGAKFHFSFCSQQNVANHTERISKRLRKAGKAIEGDGGGVVVVVVDGVVVNPRGEVEKTTPSSNADSHNSSNATTTNATDGDYRSAVVDLFHCFFKHLVDDEKECFEQFHDLFRGECASGMKKVFSFNADFEVPFVLRQRGEVALRDGLINGSTDEGPNEAIEDAENARGNLSLLVDRAVRGINSSGVWTFFSEASRGAALLTRFRDFVSTTRHSYLTAIEPSRKEKMALMIASSSSSSSSASLGKSSRKQKREFMVEAVNDPDWVRHHLDFFVENPSLFTSLGFNYDLFFAFCQTAVTLLSNDVEGEGEIAEDFRIDLTDGIEAVFKTLSLQWKIDFLTAMLDIEGPLQQLEPQQQNLHQQQQRRDEKKRAIRKLLHPESTRDRTRFLNSSTLVFNRLVDFDSSSSSSKEFGATLQGILDLCLRDAASAAESLFKQALSSNEKSGVVLHIVEKLPFIVRVCRRKDPNSDSPASLPTSSTPFSSSSSTVLQQTLLAAFESHSTQTSKERDHLKKFISDALGAFQPRWRHDPKLAFHDVAEWIVDRLLVRPIAFDSSDASDEAFGAAVDLLDSFLTSRPRRKWLTLISDGFSLVSGLLSRIHRSTMTVSSKENSKSSFDRNLLLFMASSLGSVLQDGEGFDWFVSFLLDRFDWSTTIAFLGETAEMAASKAPKMTVAGSDGAGECRVAPSLVNAIQHIWLQASMTASSDCIRWTDVLLATVVYVPEVCILAKVFLFVIVNIWL